MSVEDNKENIRRLIEEVYDKGDLSIVPELIDSDFFTFTQWDSRLRE